MGWACTYCGDVNAGVDEKCQECGTEQGARVAPRLEPQPVSASLLWLATLLGGVLAGYLIAIWNVRIVKPKQFLPTLVIYGLLAAGGYVLLLATIANLTMPGAGNGPGFAIPVALSISFLLVSIPYNRDTLAVSQWTWSHPMRRMVIRLGGNSAGFGYTAFPGVEGDLVGAAAETRSRVTIPLMPILVIAISMAIGVVTIILGNALAPK